MPFPATPPETWTTAGAIALALLAVVLAMAVALARLTRTRRAEAAAWTRLEASLRQEHERERERHRDLTRLSSDWFWEQDAARRITDISIRAGSEGERAAYLGRTSAEMGWTPMTGEPFERQLEQIARHEAYRDFRVQRLEDDGSLRCISNSATPMHDAEGRFVGWRGVGHDITRRIREERRQSLRETVARLIAERADTPTLLRDFVEATCVRFEWPGGLVVHAEPTDDGALSVEHWARSEDEALFAALAAAAATGDDAPPPAASGLRECLACPVAVEDRHFGELRFHLRGRAAADDASIAKVHNLARQIALVLARREAERQVRAEHELLEERVAERTRDLRQANEALEVAKAGADAANAAKSAFLAVMSHEIRTPMNGVIGMVEILGQSELGDEQKDAVRTIRQSAFALLALIDDILDFSKIEAGHVQVEHEPLHLGDVVEGVCDLLSPGAAAQGVELRAFVSPALPEWLRGDPTRLRQTLHNLVGNAVKFSSGRPGGGRVEVRVERSRSQPRRIAIGILDNGIGITSRQLGDLFSPFVQAEGSSTRRFGGTGLGLVICKRVVELLGGEIEVDSVEDVGSTFTVTLPLEAAEGPATPTPDLAGLHCVLVDSPALAGADLRAYLEHAGAVVHVASGVHAAVRHVAGRGGETVVVQQTGKDLRGQLKARSWFAGTPEVRHLMLVRHAPLGRPEAVLPGLATLAEASVRRSLLLQAVALAAGRPLQAATGSAEAARPRGRRQPPTIAEARARRRLILVAEDDAVNQKVILKQLALLGHAAELAGDGAEALKLWHEGGHALLLTDLHMPRMDGYRLAEAIRAAEAGAAGADGATPRPRLPILALTANALRDEASRVRAIGMDDYLTKPIQLKTLDEALDRWLPRPASEPAPETLPVPLAADGRSPGGEDAFDVAILEALVGDEPAVVREFLDDFLQTLRTQGRQLSLALERNEPQRVGAIAHKLKASSRSIGALALGDLCAQLENASKAGSRAEIERVHAEFVAAQAALDVALVVRLALQAA